MNGSTLIGELFAYVTCYYLISPSIKINAPRCLAMTVGFTFVENSTQFHCVTVITSVSSVL